MHAGTSHQRSAEVRSATIQLRCTLKTRQHLERIAKRSGIGTADVVRCLIADAPARIDLVDYLDELRALDEATARSKT